MNNTIILYTGILLLGVFIGAVSQILLKKASLKGRRSESLLK